MLAVTGAGNAFAEVVNLILGSRGEPCWEMEEVRVKDLGLLL